MDNIRAMAFFLFLLIGCDADSPRSLKHRDSAEATCKEQCAPRPMRSWDGWIGCRCVDERDPK